MLTQDFWAKCDAGEMSPKDVEKFWNTVRDGQRLSEEGGKKTVKDLKSELTWTSSRAKADLVDEWVNMHLNKIARLNRGADLSYEVAFTEDFQSRAASARLERLDAAVAGITEYDLAAYAAKIAKANESRERALSAPETLAEFFVFIQKSGTRGLTDAQLADFDRLVFEEKKARIYADRDRDSWVPRVELKDGAGLVLTGPHTHSKTGRVFWLVKLSSDSERLPRDKWNEINEAAGLLGGRYSRFHSAWPESTGGWGFATEDVAQRFIGLQYAGTDASDIRAARAADARERAAARLDNLAAERVATARRSLTANRLTNTVRRTRLAAGAQDDAYRQEQSALIVSAVASELSDGGGDHPLGNIRWASEIVELINILERSWGQAVAEEVGRWLPAEERRPIRIEDIRHAKYPIPRVKKSFVESLHLASKGMRGISPDRKVLEGLLEKLKAASGDDWVEFASTKQIDALISVGKKVGGDANCVISQSTETYARLRRVGGGSVQVLRHMLRALFPLYVSPGKIDPIVKAEMDLIGRKYPGFFWTPEDVADFMAGYLSPAAGDAVLDPSAGKGDLLEAVARLHPESKLQLQACEINGALRTILEMKGLELVGSDFLEYRPDVRPKWVIMNPPFEQNQDVAHVRHAYDLLADGGALIAIVSNSSRHLQRGETPNAERFFQDWLDEINGVWIQDLPAGTFAEAGTQVPARILYIEKNGQL